MFWKEVRIHGPLRLFYHVLGFSLNMIGMYISNLLKYTELYI